MTAPAGTAPGAGGTDRRAALLARVLDHWAATGATGASLRAVAAEVGSSHRMLLYHFGSHDGLVDAAVEEVEARQRRHLQHLAASDDEEPLSLAELAEALWADLADEQARPRETLFFGLYVRLLEQGRAERAAALVQAWSGPVERLLVERGVPAARAAAQARLGLAVTRGLLLDVLATGDRGAVDAAHAAYVAALYG